jgi:hypothetical protein
MIDSIWDVLELLVQVFMALAGLSGIIDTLQRSVNRKNKEDIKKDEYNLDC